ncbi:MAG: sulfotransferase family 2 domain-containing protein [Thermodesulfobacteriota bacterium]
MIISHKYRYIFLKTSKTAGTSIEIALSRFCGPEDIVTPISEEDEAIRASVGGRMSQPCPAKKWQYGPGDWFKYLVRGKEKPYFYNHIPARKLKKRVDPETWKNYYRFCVARNPWDRVISQYFWRCRNIPEDRRPSLDEFLASRHVRSLQRKGYKLYTIRGKVQVHRICRYENLAEDLEMVRQELGLPEPLALPGAKAGHRKDRRHYREIFTPRQREKVAALFADEIRLMNYTF